MSAWGSGFEILQQLPGDMKLLVKQALLVRGETVPNLFGPFDVGTEVVEERGPDSLSMLRVGVAPAHLTDVVGGNHPSVHARTLGAITGNVAPQLLSVKGQ